MHRLALGTLFAISCAVVLRAADDDPKEIVRRALELNARNDEIARSYTFIQRSERLALDATGGVKHRESETWDITLREGSPYRRLIQRDDKPLPPKEEQQEQAKLEKSNEERHRETPEQRSERIAAWERSRRRQQEQLKEVPDAFDFRLLREEDIDGISTWVIEGTPHSGYKPRSRFSAFYGKMQGRIWVAKADYQPVKFEAETTDTVSIGGFLARVNKGTRIVVEYTRVNGEVWLPKHVGFRGAARLLLVKGLHIDTELTFSNYKKFSVESRVVAQGQ
jgi:hypothetical protein